MNTFTIEELKELMNIVRKSMFKNTDKFLNKISDAIDEAEKDSKK